MILIFFQILMNKIIITEGVIALHRRRSFFQLVVWRILSISLPTVDLETKSWTDFKNRFKVDIHEKFRVSFLNGSHFFRKCSVKYRRPSRTSTFNLFLKSFRVLGSRESIGSRLEENTHLILAGVTSLIIIIFQWSLGKYN